MLDGISLDQLRAFIAAADEGSFSAAARKLRRAQSAVSELISNLEAQVGVQLFDRTGRYPKLTAAGLAILADARGVAGGVDFLKARAKGMSSGLEAELTAVVDVHYPITAVAGVANEFRLQFPATPLRLFVEALGAVHQRVLDGSASVGVAATFATGPASLSSERLAGVRLVMVAARNHPLARFHGTIPKSELAQHVQLVLTDRSTLSAGIEFGVVSPSTWRLADLSAKHAFILNGLGWGGLPTHVAERDLSEGNLVPLTIEDFAGDGPTIPMSAIYPTASPPGPAGRWFIEQLKVCP
eukprot:GHVR01039533.1.p1 GENE.GHVR01039533.1~~GHVR01039533.1.p1  ORF type:complete len:298 (-),score=39.91 GHVR01039533.1:200-1093(-)